MQETKNILVIVFVSNLTNCAHKERSNERGFILMRNTDRTCIALGRVRIRNRRENGIFKGLMACYLGLLKREGKNGQQCFGSLAQVKQKKGIPTHCGVDPFLEDSSDSNTSHKVGFVFFYTLPQIQQFYKMFGRL